MFLATPPLVLGRRVASLSSTSYSAASSGETLSGEAVRLVDRSEGKKVLKRVGELDALRVNRGGRSVVVRDRWWPLSNVDAGGGRATVGPFSSMGGGGFVNGILLDS